MAELFDKLIQDGRESFVPRSNKTRAFWTKHNYRIAGSQNAQREMVTILPATEDEMAALRATVDTPAIKPMTITIPVPNNELEALKQQVAEQQEQLNKLLERGKPGPKPKE